MSIYNYTLNIIYIWLFVSNKETMGKEIKGKYLTPQKEKQKEKHFIPPPAKKNPQG